MRYLGGKRLLSKYLAPFLAEQFDLSKAERYIEPFAGSLAVAERLAEMNLIDPSKMILSDFHEDLILMFQAMRDGWEPPQEVSEDLWNELRFAESSALRGFVGFGCSFGGMFFQGYAKGGGMNYAAMSSRTIKRALKSLETAEIGSSCYLELDVGMNSFVYADPPYRGVLAYNGIEFDHDEFWDWVREQSRRSTVLVSEFSAPDDFEIVWKRERVIRIRNPKAPGNIKRAKKLQKKFDYVWRLK